MNPTPAKDLLPQVSEQTDLPLELLQDLHDFYWNNLRKTVVSMDELYVMVPHLGTFAIKGDIVLDREITKYSPILQNFITHPPRTPVQHARFLDVKQKIDKLQSLKKAYLDNKQEKLKIKTIRNEIRAAKENLEGQRPDL